MKQIEVTLERHNITFQESFCCRCSLDKIVKMAVEKRFGVDEKQQVVSLAVVGVKGGLYQLSLSGTSTTLFNVISLLPPAPLNSGKGVVARLKVTMVPVMTINESDLMYVSRLGSGSYGAVFKYIHVSSSREVAVKTLHEEIISDYNVDRFRLEAEIVSSLQHPNIVKCIGTCTTRSGRLQIVSELMCCSLRQFLCQKRLNFKEVVAIALGVAKGMDSLHQCRTTCTGTSPATTYFWI